MGIGKYTSHPMRPKEVTGPSILLPVGVEVSGDMLLKDQI